MIWGHDRLMRHRGAEQHFNARIFGGEHRDGELRGAICNRIKRGLSRADIHLNGDGGMALRKFGENRGEDRACGGPIGVDGHMTTPQPLILVDQLLSGFQLARDLAGAGRQNLPPAAVKRMPRGFRSTKGLPKLCSSLSSWRTTAVGGKC